MAINWIIQQQQEDEEEERGSNVNKKRCSIRSHCTKQYNNNDGKNENS